MSLLLLSPYVVVVVVVGCCFVEGRGMGAWICFEMVTVGDGWRAIWRWLEVGGRYGDGWRLEVGWRYDWRWLEVGGWMAI